MKLILENITKYIGYYKTLDSRLGQTCFRIFLIYSSSSWAILTITHFVIEKKNCKELNLKLQIENYSQQNKHI
jgi:hypothetical protein